MSGWSLVEYCIGCHDEIHASWIYGQELRPRSVWKRKSWDASRRRLKIADVSFTCCMFFICKHVFGHLWRYLSRTQTWYLNMDPYLGPRSLNNCGCWGHDAATDGNDAHDGNASSARVPADMVSMQHKRMSSHLGATIHEGKFDETCGETGKKYQNIMKLLIRKLVEEVRLWNMMNISITKAAQIGEYADLGFGVSGGRAGKLQQVRRCIRDLEILERQTYHKLPDISLERLERTPISKHPKI